MPTTGMQELALQRLQLALQGGLAIGAQGQGPQVLGLGPDTLGGILGGGLGR